MNLKPEHAKLGLPGFYETEDIDVPDRYTGWAPGDDGLGGGSGWTEHMLFHSWQEFKNGWSTEGDVDLNLIADFYFTSGASLPTELQHRHH